MSIVEKVIAAVTPTASEEERRQARDKARALADPGGWLDQVLDHHLLIERAFEQLRVADQVGPRLVAQKQLAVLLTGHALAEEAVLYPALALHGEKLRSEMSYLEHSGAKVQLAVLEDLDPMSPQYLEQLEHLRGVVAQHVYEEEGSRYPALLEKTDAAKNDMLASRYREEFARYFDEPRAGSAALSPGRETP